MPLPPPFEARVVGGRALSPGVREISLERTDGQPMAFEPGQWLNLILPASAGLADLPGGEPSALKRSYSIASSPAGSPRFEIAVTRVQDGPGSTFLHEVAPGTTLQCIGPQGFFTRAASSASPSLFIATGTGVTPMRSMIQAAVAAGSTAPMWLLFGVRHDTDVLYADEMTALARQHAFLRFEPTLSRASERWSGRRGYVQAHVKELWAELVATSAAAPGGTPHAYICGLERMVGSVREILRTDLGLPRQQVHSERYD
jgi:CDP-4-dehydro-6-deoxyglucose reductase